MRAGEHDRVAIWITQPALPVSVFAPMARFDDVCLQLFGTRNRGVEVVQFKPQENAVSIRPKFRITQWTVLVLDIPVVQLKDQGFTGDQSLIVRPTVPALATEQTLIPAAACLDVVHANEWL